jgi:PA14 domain
MPAMPALYRLLLAASIALGLAACTTAPGTATGSGSASASGPAPLNPQPAAAALRPGLQMLYFYGDFKHIDNMPTTPAELAKGQRGGTVANLASASDSGKMWGIASAELYGAHFTGLIRLEAGEYTFFARSNDGVRVTIDRTRVVDDPGVHADRFSEPGRVTIGKPGWYPLTVQYFQRRNTASLELHWKRPGAGAAEIVPAVDLAHLPG